MSGDYIDAAITGGKTLPNGGWAPAPRLSDVTGPAVLLNNPSGDFAITLSASEAQSIGLPAATTRLRVVAGNNWVHTAIQHHPYLADCSLVAGQHRLSASATLAAAATVKRPA